MKKIQYILLLAVIAAFILTGCGADSGTVSEESQNQKDTYKIYLITKWKNAPFWEDLNEGCQQAAKELGNIEYKWTAPEKAQSPLQGKCVDEAVAEGANAILISSLSLTDLSDNFAKADEALCTTVRDLMEFITVDEHVNILFDDLKKMLKDSGVAFMGTGNGKREHAFRKAINNALRSPFFNDRDVNNSKKVLLNIVIANNSGVCHVTKEDFDDVYDFMTKLKSGVGIDFIWGMAAVKKRSKSVKATVLATGFELKDVDPLFHG